MKRFYRKRPVVVEAYQWHKNGDHPDDACDDVIVSEQCAASFPEMKVGDHFQGEGHIVRYFRHPEVPGDRPCAVCGKTMHVHGWIDTLEGGHNVCPGDYIITGVKGERYPCKPDIFVQTYEQACWEEKP